MPDLNFEVQGAEAVSHAASPLLAFKLRVVNANATELIHAVVLRCQIMIEATRRNYSAGDQARLLDLFGEPERWGQTVRTMLWTHASIVMPSFTGEKIIDLPVPCTFDFNVAAVKYFAGLDDGEAPLSFLFSGTVFYEADDGVLQIAQISWDKEARFRLPVKVWNEMMDLYYPNTGWLCLRRDVFDRLHQYKVRRGIPTWEQTVESLLPTLEEENGEETKGKDRVH